MVAPLGHSSDPPRSDVQLANRGVRKAQGKCEASEGLFVHYISLLDDESQYVYIYISYIIFEKNKVSKKNNHQNMQKS